MNISLSYLNQIKQKFLKLIEKENLKSTTYIDALLSEDDVKEFDVDDLSDHKIIVSMTASNQGTKAHTISYAIQGTGIPLEIKMNTELNYGRITLKNRDILVGYKPFWEDPFQNIIQEKKINCNNLDEVIEELRKELKSEYEEPELN